MKAMLLKRLSLIIALAILLVSSQAARGPYVACAQDPWWDRVSDACHIDVACDYKNPEGRPWRDMIAPVRSTVYLYFPWRTGDNKACGGVLVNNTSGTLVPYVITAWHCSSNWEVEAPNIEFYWNYEHPDCREPRTWASGQPGDGPIDQVQVGAVLRDTWPDADIVLLQLDDFPDPAWNVYYAGWDATASPPTKSVYIHFPEWAEKRITFADHPATACFLVKLPVVGCSVKPLGCLSSWPGSCPRLSIEDWELGGFQGSSGSPLFNQYHRLVGVGSGYFEWTQVCRDPPYEGSPMTAFFGRLYAAWDSKGDIHQNSLRYYLDRCLTGNDKFDGIDPVSPFVDVPVTHREYYYIDAVYRAGYIAACSESPRMYCPDSSLTRAEMAVFIERGYHGPRYTPAEPDEQIFADVPPGMWYFKWATALWEDKFTAGCGTDPLIYCPLQENTRAEAAVFFLHMLNGPSYFPPPPQGIFTDVPIDAWYAKWVEAAYNAKTGPLKRDRLMEACQETPAKKFCPLDPIPRKDVAKTMVRAMGISLCLPPPPDIASSADETLPYPPEGSASALAEGGLELAPDDTSAQALLPAPTLEYNSYLGGGGDDAGNDLAVDGAGNIYVVGYTDSSDFPGAGTLHGGRDAFVARLNADGGGLAYVTYLGGSDLDEGTGIAVDGAGNAYVVGYTDSADFTTRSPAQSTNRGERDAFVAKLNASGGLVYSTYLGGSGVDEGLALAIDSAGNAYLAGRTLSKDFPTRNPRQASNAGGYDIFVTKLNASGGLVYSTYLGGSGNDAAHGLAVDAAGNAYLTGDSGSTDFPLQGPLQGAPGGGQDAFAAKLNASGSGLVYGTYLGGNGGDFGHDIAVDSVGNAYLTGHTASIDFPLANPLQSNHAGGYDVFVAKLNPSGSALVYSTYLGADGGDEGHGIVVDGDGVVTLTGRTGSIHFPRAGFPTATGGLQDLFVASLPADGSRLHYSRYLGGNAGDEGEGIALDSEGSVYLTGYTLSPNLTTLDPLQASLGGDRDAFVAKIGEGYTLYLPAIFKGR